MNQKILSAVQSLKQELQKEGFVIDGIFGSYARNEESQSSDLDILYHLDESFYNKYRGFIGFKRLDEIKAFISEKTDRKIDLAPKNNLSKTAQKYILSEVIYV